MDLDDWMGGLKFALREKVDAEDIKNTVLHVTRSNLGEDLYCTNGKCQYGYDKIHKHVY